MECEKSREMLIDYIGDEITGKTAKELKRHLQECSQCREELASLTRTRSLLRQAWPDEGIPESLVFELPGSRARRFWSLWDRYGLAKFGLASLTVTACLILCFVSLSFLRSRFQVDQNRFVISFGQVAESSLQKVSRTGRDSSSAEWASRREVQEMIGRAIEQLEANQKLQMQQLIGEIGVRMEAKRTADLRRIANELRILEGSQNNVYRQALSNQSYMETLARDFLLKANAPATSMH